MVVDCVKESRSCFDEQERKTNKFPWKEIGEGLRSRTWRKERPLDMMREEEHTYREGGYGVGEDGG